MVVAHIAIVRAYLVALPCRFPQLQKRLARLELILVMRAGLDCNCRTHRGATSGGDFRQCSVCLRVNGAVHNTSLRSHDRLRCADKQTSVREASTLPPRKCTRAELMPQRLDSGHRRSGQSMYTSLASWTQSLRRLACASLPHAVASDRSEDGMQQLLVVLQATVCRLEHAIYARLRAAAGQGD